MVASYDIRSYPIFSYDICPCMGIFTSYGSVWAYSPLSYDVAFGSVCVQRNTKKMLYRYRHHFTATAPHLPIFPILNTPLPLQLPYAPLYRYRSPFALWWTGICRHMLMSVLPSYIGIYTPQSKPPRLPTYAHMSGLFCPHSGNGHSGYVRLYIPLYILRSARSKNLSADTICGHSRR